MYYDFLVKIPEGTGKISLNTRNGTTYVEYTYARKYIPEKKYNVPKRTTIGKVCEEDTTMMYPNPNYLKFFPETEVPDELDRSRRSCCLKIGAYAVIKKIILFECRMSRGFNGEGSILALFISADCLVDDILISSFETKVLTA